MRITTDFFLETSHVCAKYSRKYVARSPLYNNNLMIFKLRRWAAPALLQLVSPVVRGSPWPGSGALGHWARRAGGNSTQARELSSAADEPPSACRVGICFDIDGVFKYGGAYHPHGASLLRKVAAAFWGAEGAQLLAGRFGAGGPVLTTLPTHVT